MNERAAALAKAKERIVKLRKAMTEKFVKLASEIEALEACLPITDSREFLVARCGLSSSELKMYSEFATKLKGYEELLQQRSVNYEVLRGLTNSSKTVREIALAKIASGIRFDLTDLKVVRRGVADSRLSDFEYQAKASKRAMLVSARKKAAEAVDRFQHGTASLLDKVANLPLATSKASERKCVEAISRDAAALLPIFETIAGADHPTELTKAWRDVKESARRKAKVHSLLRALAAPTNEKKQNLPIHAERLRNGRLSIITNLARFAGNNQYMSLTVPGPEKILTRLPDERVRALELCAGAGGMAVGLESAGFEHVALVEFNKDAAATMRLNRPDWPVVEADMTSIDFSEYRGKVDLVCGGMPCQPYSEEGRGKGKDDARDLLLQGARAVREIQPQAFLFENVRGALFGKHADQIAAFLKELGEAGYTTQIVEVNTQDYGVAQNRPRILFVGLRADQRLRAFEMPRFPERRANVGDVLFDLMAANGWSDVNNWAAYCRTVTFELQDGTVVQGAQASTLTGRKGKSQQKEGLRWARNGLSPAGLPDEAPTDALSREVGPDFVPGITLRMRARLQDFSDTYQFVGGKESVAKQIGNAVAPRLAQAAGLALQSVLRGHRFDVEKMLWPDEPASGEQTRVGVAAPALAPDLQSVRRQFA